MNERLPLEAPRYELDGLLRGDHAADEPALTAFVLALQAGVPKAAPAPSAALELLLQGRRVETAPAALVLPRSERPRGPVWLRRATTAAGLTLVTGAGLVGAAAASVLPPLAQRAVSSVVREVTPFSVPEPAQDKPLPHHHPASGVTPGSTHVPARPTRTPGPLPTGVVGVGVVGHATKTAGATSTGHPGPRRSSTPGPTPTETTAAPTTTGDSTTPPPPPTTTPGQAPPTASPTGHGAAPVTPGPPVPTPSHPAPHTPTTQPTHPTHPVTPPTSGHVRTPVGPPTGTTTSPAGQPTPHPTGPPTSSPATSPAHGSPSVPPGNGNPPPRHNS